MRPTILLILCLSLLALTSCATSRIATSIGDDIGRSFQCAAAKGEISAEQSIKAWPYVSGLIRGLLAEDYEFKVSLSAQNVMDSLDELSLQDELSGEDKGRIIGLYVRLEYLAMREFWDRYGISIYGAVKSFLLR